MQYVPRPTGALDTQPRWPPFSLLLLLLFVVAKSLFSVGQVGRRQLKGHSRSLKTVGCRKPDKVCWKLHCITPRRLGTCLHVPSFSYRGCRGKWQQQTRS
ncbi:hypothetical protein GGS20DRAFT_530647 [Poronia punctata]|nr:hypothetical protein GGS20DRAFT_530647 [Poronia punctata]